MSDSNDAKAAGMVLPGFAGVLPFQSIENPDPRNPNNYLTRGASPKYGDPSAAASPCPPGYVYDASDHYCKRSEAHPPIQSNVFEEMPVNVFGDIPHNHRSPASARRRHHW